MFENSLVTDRNSALATLNPLVSLILVGIIAAALLISFSPVTTMIMLLAEVGLVIAARLPIRTWLARAWPLGCALLGIMITNLIFTDVRTGSALVQVGGFMITTGGVAAAAGVGLRLLALALPGIVLFARLNPTELSDALITHWRANPRIAVGSLAALRMAPLVFADLRQSYAARRTRGVISRNQLVALPTLFGTLATILVTAIRRATRLSLAMDSRGFDSGVQRTLARESVWRARDWSVVIGGLLIAMIAVTAGLLTRH
jgi:energy-coupling factor transport system permease protein